MIVYFSGTGNSLLVARMLQELTEDEIASIPDLISNGTKNLTSNRPFVIVSPIYAWKIPNYVEDFIERTEFKGTGMVYFVMTCGGEAGFNCKYVENLCKRKGLEFMGEVDLTMPDNYLIMDDPPGEEKARKMIECVVPQVREAAEHISNGELIHTSPHGGMFRTYVVNPLFYKFNIDCDGFKVTSSCDGCGRCVSDCPTECVSMSKGKPKWSGECIQCLSCINKCPRTAIEFKSKTKGKNRYVCPITDPKEIL
ncbi:MAG: EFR1 family ferrodoxin [Candidatus Methanomethylophilaceae archaeon]